jgi:gluconolactonase
MQVTQQRLPRFAFGLFLVGTLSGLSVAAAVADEIVGDNPRPVTMVHDRTAGPGGGMTEGPAVGPDGSIYFSYISFAADVPGEILRYDPATGRTETFIENSRKSNGLKVTKEGRLIACEGAHGGGRSIAVYDLNTKKRTVLSSRVDGKAYNAPNDLCLDSQGRIFFTDPRYLGDEPLELERQSVYCVLPDGSSHLCTDQVEKPNGVALSLDGRTLYVADNNPAPDGAKSVLAFALGADGRTVGKLRLVLDMKPLGGGCDGMCLDAHGRLYLTPRTTRRLGILVVHPESGRELSWFSTEPDDKPADSAADAFMPSNVCFGSGRESHVLYITAGTKLMRKELNPAVALAPGK